MDVFSLNPWGKNGQAQTAHAPERPPVATEIVTDYFPGEQVGFSRANLARFFGTLFDGKVERSLGRAALKAVRFVRKASAVAAEAAMSFGTPGRHTQSYKTRTVVNEAIDSYANRFEARLEEIRKTAEPLGEAATRVVARVPALPGTRAWGTIDEQRPVQFPLNDPVSHDLAAFSPQSTKGPEMPYTQATRPGAGDQPVNMVFITQ